MGREYRTEQAGDEHEDRHPNRAVQPDQASGLQEVAAAAGNRAVGRGLASGHPLVTRGSVLGADGTTELEGTTITGRRSGFAEELHSTVLMVSTRLSASTANYGVQVLNACEAFRAFATPKVRKLAGEVTAQHLVEQLVGGLLTPVAGLTAKIAVPAAKWLADKVVAYITSGMTSSVGQAVGPGTDVQALEAAIASLVQGARDTTTRLGVAAQQSIDERFGQILQRSAAGEQLSADDEALVGPFWGADPASLDAAIEKLFGIPGPATAAVVQAEVYRELVAAFMRIYINRTAPWEENLNMAMQEMIGDKRLGLPGRAGTAADEAAGVRAAALGVTWQQLARAGREYEEAVRLGLKPPPREEYEKFRDHVGAR
ncbi:MAG TPA: hypothetical protein VFP72_18375 [Kineosporiaceae bacterium]|nr:hypothetical protein [Kineosporiaceae bacterium]